MGDIAPIQEAIRFVMGKDTSTDATFVSKVTAIVGGNEVVSNEEITVWMDIGTNNAKVYISWEDLKHLNAKALGLYSEMNSDYQHFTTVDSHTLQIVYTNYTILINYAGAKVTFSRSLRKRRH